MALSHSRVKNVFYVEPDPRNGALGSKDEIHALSQLNHRYVLYDRVCTDLYDRVENFKKRFIFKIQRIFWWVRRLKSRANEMKHCDQDLNHAESKT